MKSDEPTRALIKSAFEKCAKEDESRLLRRLAQAALTAQANDD